MKAKNNKLLKKYYKDNTNYHKKKSSSAVKGVPIVHKVLKKIEKEKLDFIIQPGVEHVITEGELLRFHPGI